MTARISAPRCARTRFVALAVAVALSGALSLSTARADDLMPLPEIRTWLGAGGTFAASNPANWDQFPVSGHIQVFGTNISLQYHVDIDTSSLDAFSVLFPTSPAAYLFTGGKLNVGDSIQNYAPSTQVMNVAVHAGSALDVRGNNMVMSSFVNDGGDFTLNAGMFTGNALTLNDLLMDNIAGAHTFTIKGFGDINVTSPHATGSASFVYKSTGNLNLRGTATYTGSTAVGGAPTLTGSPTNYGYGSGNMTINFNDIASPQNNLINNGGPPASLWMSGANLFLKGDNGEANSQVFSNFYVYPGYNEVTLTAGVGGAMNLDVGLIDRASAYSTGVVNFNFGSDTSVTTDSLNRIAGLGGLLDSNAIPIINRQAFAYNLTNTVDGQLAPVTGVANNPTFTALGQYANVDYAVNAIISISTAVGTLRINNPAANIITMSSSLYLYERAILRTAAAAPGTAINGGFLIGQGGLVIMNYGPGTFTISAIIANYLTNATNLEVVGDPASETILTANNMYTGTTNVSNTKLTVSSGNALGPGASAVNLDNAELNIVDTVLLYSGSNNKEIGVSDRGGIVNIAFNKYLVTRATNRGKLLTKNGAGTMVIEGLNDIDTLKVVGGWVQVGAGGTTGDIGDGKVELQTAKIAFIRSNDFVVDACIEGDGNIIKSMTSRVTFTNKVELNGELIINGGSVYLLGESYKFEKTYGAGTLRVQDAAQLVVNGVYNSRLEVRGKVKLMPLQTLASIVDVLEMNPPTALQDSIASAAAPNAALIVVTYPGQLDVTDNAFIVRATDATDKAAKIAALTAAINAGSNGGTWTGNGITSSTAAANATRFGVGIFDNEVHGFTSFGGQTVNTNSIIMDYAHLGDSNDDGIVDIQDLGVIANNWQLPVTTWSRGDFNGDGVVDIQDLGILANNWQLSAFSAALTSFPQFSGTSVTGTSIPEPATISLLALSAGLLLRRRRSSRPEFTL